MENNNFKGAPPKSEWYKQTWAIVLLLIFFFPVGIFLMWKYSTWKQGVKIAISVVFGLFVIGNMNNKKEDTVATNTKVETKAEETKKEEPKVVEKTPEEIAKEKADAEKKAAADAETARIKAENLAKAKAAAEEEAKVGYDTGITFENLARTPDAYKGKKVKFTGKIIQVISGSNSSQYRLAVNSDYDQILYIEVSKSQLSSGNILDNDNISIQGISLGTIDYKSALGGQITVPAVTVDSFTINK